VLPEWDTLWEQSEVWVKKAHDEGRGEVLTVERVKGMRHGWTQFPETFLKKHETKEKKRVFEDTVRWMDEVCPTTTTTTTTTTNEERANTEVTGKYD
jgi:hypothetical protein